MTAVLINIKLWHFQFVLFPCPHLVGTGKQNCLPVETWLWWAINRTVRVLSYPSSRRYNSVEVVSSVRLTYKMWTELLPEVFSLRYDKKKILKIFFFFFKMRVHRALKLHLHPVAHLLVCFLFNRKNKLWTHVNGQPTKLKHFLVLFAGK